jgi:hypothetical protein
MPRKVSRYAPRKPEVRFALDSYAGRSVSYTIMAHKKREAWAKELAEQLSCDITWDEKNDRHDTGIRAINAYEKGVTHHCVIQDDAILADNFKENVEELIKYTPEEAPIGLYYGAKGSARSAHVEAHNQATKHDASWLIRKGPIWGPGIIYPVKTIYRLTQFYENSPVQNYDRRVMRFYQSINQNCWYTIPSLVDHRAEDNPSLCGHNKEGRQARVFGPQSDPSMRWNGTSVRSNV